MEVNKAFRWALTAAGSGAAAFHEALQLYERALELWDQVDDPESLAGSHASLLMRAGVRRRGCRRDRTIPGPGERCPWMRWVPMRIRESASRRCW